MKTAIPLAKLTLTLCVLCLLLPRTLLAGNVLDKAGNPTATPVVAFSLRQLSSAYTGNAIQVLRSSDSALQDIGFTPAGDLDTVMLKNFVGSGNGYVYIWYDQSGNGLNATQTITTILPTIMIGGIINRDNGRPAVYTYGSNGYLSYGPVNQLNGTIPVTRMEVARSRSDNFGITEGLGNFQLDLQLPPSQVMVQYQSNNITITSATLNQKALMAINSVRNSAASQLYINTAFQGSNTAALGTFSSPKGYIGVRFDYALGNSGPGAFSETILFNSVLSDADRQAINYNQNWYYSLGFAPCSSTQTNLSPNGITTKTLYACTQDSTWAYYYDPANPLKLLFGIAKDPGNAGANTTFMADSINLTATSTPNLIYYSAISGTEGIFAPGRYWNVYTHTALTSPVNVRFFYDPADTVAAFKAAQLFKSNSGAAMMSSLRWFKTVGNPFTPDSLTAIPKAAVKGSTITLTPLYGKTKDSINYAEFDGVTSFSGGTGVYIVSSTPSTLPIIISSFNGTRINETTVLSWTTASEANSDRFDIEQSTDGKTWTKIGQVAAAGNSSATLHYQFTSATTPYGATSLYYRLKLVDKDGRNTYSGIVWIKLADNIVVAPQVSDIVPNPFTNDVAITCTLPANGAVTVLLQDMKGATLMRYNYTAIKGSNVLQLTNLTKLARGMYIVRVVQQGASGIGKVVKQ